MFEYLLRDIRSLSFLLIFGWTLHAHPVLAKDLSLSIDSTAKFDFERCQIIRMKLKNSSEQTDFDYLKNQEAQCLREMSHSFINLFFSSNSSGFITRLTEDKLADIITELRDNPFFPHDLIESGNCFHRANLIAFYMFNRGIKTSRIFASGDLYIRGPLYNSGVRWFNHVAILVSVKGFFKDRELIIDPSLSDSALTISEWVKLLEEKEKGKVRIDRDDGHAIEILLRNDVSQNQKDYVIQSTAESMLRDIFETFDNIGSIPERYESKMSVLLPYLYYVTQKDPRFPDRTRYRKDDD